MLVVSHFYRWNFKCKQKLCTLAPVRIITGMDRNAPEWTGTHRNGPERTGMDIKINLFYATKIIILT